MTATNHVVTGSLIVVAVRQPALALPLAFAMHFVLDALPHFGNRTAPYARKMQITRHILPFDMLIAAAILVIIALVRPAHWQYIDLGGILCASPDLMWFPGFVRAMRGETVRRPLRGIMKFHSRIQWGERPWGAWIEALWFVVLGGVMLVHL